MSTGRNGVLTAFAANQRDEVRDLHDVAAALTAQPGMKQQTFVAGITAKGNGDCFLSEERHTALSGGGGMPGQGYPAIFTAAFSAGAGASAGSIGYGEEVSPTLKGTASGNCMPSILCLNDQGGSAIACSENVAGTLRAQEHGHQPLGGVRGQATDIEIEAREIIRMLDRVNKLIADATGQPLEKVKKDTDRSQCPFPSHFMLFSLLPCNLFLYFYTLRICTKTNSSPS